MPLASSQPTLFDRRPLEAQFDEFHAANPHVYEEFARFTREAIAAGRKRIGAKLIFERLRWHTEIETRGEDFKVNNNYSAFYARLWMRNNPGHGDVFATRKQRSA